jgi:hypothetical protein
LYAFASSSSQSRKHSASYYGVNQTTRSNAQLLTMMTFYVPLNDVHVENPGLKDTGNSLFGMVNNHAAQR